MHGWMRRIAGTGLILILAGSLAAQQGLRSRRRTEREWAVKAKKMERFLQPAMRRNRIDMWIILSRENNPDALLDLFGGYGISGWYGHRNAYIFYDPGGDRPLETAVIGTHLSDHLARFFKIRIPYREEGLAPHLKEFVEKRDPQRIAINESRTISMADGLTAALKQYLVRALGPRYAQRLVSSERLVMDYVSRRLPEEIEITREASWITWNILHRALSNEVITPGKTTLMDVYWWIVDEWKNQGLEFNFPPGLDIQRAGEKEPIDDARDPVIRPGDLIHVDFGVRLSGLVTDQQKMAYVLYPGETEPPEGLQRAFAQSVRMAEIILQELKPGRTGVEVKKAAEARGRAAGIENLVYCHVQGNWVHDVGAWVAPDWPERYGIHPREPVRTSEIWSIEFRVTVPVPEWGGQKVNILREEDAWIDDRGRVHYLAGPQMRLWTIRTSNPTEPSSP